MDDVDVGVLQRLESLDMAWERFSARASFLLTSLRQIEPDDSAPQAMILSLEDSEPVEEAEGFSKDNAPLVTLAPSSCTDSTAEFADVSVSMTRITCTEVHDITQIFTLGRSLGKGGFGSVVLGHNIVERSDFALKMITNTTANKYKSLVETEIDVMTVLNHPNIVKLHRVVMTPSHVVLCMDYVKGGELFDRIVRMKHFSEEVARDILDQLLDVLEELKLATVIHRDLKPENILMNSDDVNDTSIKITDFGLATKESNMVPGSLGTPEYAAPEVLKNLPHSYSCDLWSVGVILFVMLSGYPPFYGTRDHVVRTVKAGIIEFRPSEWSHISAEAQDLVRRLLDPSPATRITITEARQHPWMWKDWSSVMGGAPLLRTTTDRLSYYQATIKFRKAVFAALLTHRMEYQFAHSSRAPTVKKIQITRPHPNLRLAPKPRPITPTAAPNIASPIKNQLTRVKGNEGSQKAKSVRSPTQSVTRKGANGNGKNET
eukprot:c4875_g1_i1.p1 GENE.c4875_g1_i1~~c4875_g1_i1.p1  ORF type:complete len:489 (+),score=108.75 c4875_g1_i1:38-1504(+)